MPPIAAVCCKLKSPNLKLPAMAVSFAHCMSRIDETPPIAKPLYKSQLIFAFFVLSVSYQVFKFGILKLLF